MSRNQSRPFRAGDVVSREEVERQMRAQPGQVVNLNDITKAFYCLEENEFREKIIVGDLDNSPMGNGALRIQGVMGHASHRQAAASGMTVEDPDRCMHGTTKEAYSSAYQNMLDNFLRDLDERVGALPDPGPGKYRDTTAAMGILMDCLKEQNQIARSQLGEESFPDIARHAFAACARKILTGGDEEFDHAHDGMLFALAFQYLAPTSIMPVVSSTDQEVQQQAMYEHAARSLELQERFQVYSSRLRKTRRGVIRVLAKHLPCDCAKNVKPITRNIGREVKRCDCCEELFLATQIKQCAKCKMVNYCGRTCQLKDWNEGDHKHQCKLMRSSSS